MKNKLIKIFVFSIILLCCFSFCEKVKAASVTNVPIVDGYVNIPTHPDNDLMLFCMMSSFNSVGQLTIDGNNFTEMNRVNVFNDAFGSPTWGTILYISNPTPGQRLLGIPGNNYGYITTVKCFLVSGVDTSNPFLNDTSVNNVYTAYPNGVNGNLLLNVLWRDWNGNLETNSSPTFTTVYLYPSGDRVASAGYAYKNISSSLESPNYTSTISKGTFIEFNNATPTEYCGDTFCQTAMENCSICPIDCGECASNPNSGDSLNLFFFSNPYTFSNQSTAIVRYLYNENVFTPYDHIEIRKINSDWTSSFIATSTIIDTTGLFTSKSNGNSYFTLTGDATTTGYIHYEVIGHLAGYWSPTLGEVEATTTIPYVVTVNWQPTQIINIADILAASSTNPFYDDAVMYEAACSEEDWNTPPPEIFGVDVPALNLTVIGCKFKLGFIIAGNKFTSLATDGIYRAGNILKNVFPFNIYTNLNDSWKASANATVMTELAFLSPVNGNLTVQIPTTGTSTATIVLWGKDIFTSSSTLGTINAEKTNQLFLAIKTIIKWALWGLFGLWAIKNGKAFIDKMTGGQ